jgi:ribonucleotide reductase beta subunit family protein with ferritin-like domain
MSSIVEENYVEYICDPRNEQPGFFPRRHLELHELYKKHTAQYWPSTEVRFENDRIDFREKLTDDERHVIMYVQMFFSQSDGLIQKNLSVNFLNTFTLREAIDFLSVQNHAETVHNETYGLIIQELFSDQIELCDKITHAIANFPQIKKMSLWYGKWCGSTNPFAEVLFAQVPSEGLLFQGCFAILYWVRHYKGAILAGITKANELISKDENLHATFFATMYRMLGKRLTDERAHEIMDEAYTYASDFINNAIRASVIGLNADTMNTYLMYVADYWLTECGHPKKYNVKNPYPWMIMMAAPPKTNFHEKVVSAYGDTPDKTKTVLITDF